MGRLAQAFKTPPSTEHVSASVPAIAHWSKANSEAALLGRLKTDEWEVVIQEIVTGGTQ